MWQGCDVACRCCPPTKPHTCACRLKSITAQRELHDQLKVMRCEKYVAEALHAADLEAEEQVSRPTPLDVVFTSSHAVCKCACVQR